MISLLHELIQKNLVEIELFVEQVDTGILTEIHQILVELLNDLYIELEVQI